MRTTRLSKTPGSEPLQSGDKLLRLPEGPRILASIIENSEDAIIGKRLDGTILSWNRGAARLFGYRHDEMIGQPIFRIIPPDRVTEEREILRRLRHGERINHYETVRRHKDGRLLDVSIAASPIRDEGGHIIGAAKILRDITDRKRMEAELRDSEQLMRAILDTAADVIITIDESGIIQSANAAAEQLFGYPLGELVGQNVSLLMPEPFRGEHDRYIRNYLQTGRAKVIGIGREVTGLKKDGTAFPIHLAVGEVRLGERRLFTGVIHDLSARRFLEQQIIQAASNEQRRIGRDLHDSLCQDLIGIAFSVDNVIRRLPPDCVQARDLLGKIAASVRTTAGQARDLSHGLNPVDVRAGGLQAALESLTSKVSESFGIRCGFRCDPGAQVSDDASATHLFRIAQEAISNAIKHGKARKIDVELELFQSTIVLSIRDDGKGMPKGIAERIKRGFALSGPSMRERAAVPGIGLQTMQYRARVIGGILTADTCKGGGTVITCILRCEPEAINSRPGKAPSGKVVGAARSR